MLHIRHHAKASKNNSLGFFASGNHMSWYRVAGWWSIHSVRNDAPPPFSILRAVSTVELLCPVSCGMWDSAALCSPVYGRIRSQNNSGLSIAGLEFLTWFTYKTEGLQFDFDDCFFFQGAEILLKSLFHFRFMVICPNFLRIGLYLRVILRTHWSLPLPGTK